MTTHAAPHGDLGDAITLHGLLDRLGPAVLDVAAAPLGLDIPVAEVVIWDGTTQGRGAVVLAVGVDATFDQVALVHQLAALSASAVVVRLAGAVDADVLTAADAVGVAVLTTPPELAWGRLFSLTETALARPPAQIGGEQAPLGDLFALVNAVAAMVGGATTIEDAHSRVLAYSSLEHPIDLPRQQTILGREVPEEWMRRLQAAGVFRRLWQSDDVVHVGDFADLDIRPRLAVAVRAGGEVLGSIWVVEGDRELGAEAEGHLREAARIAALHLLRHRTDTDVVRQQRGDAVRQLLDGRPGAQAALGVGADTTLAVVAIDTGPADDATAMARGQRVADLVAVFCESYRRHAACAVLGGRVYAVVPVDPDDTASAVTFAESIATRCRDVLRVAVRCGVGAAGAGAAGVARSRRQADEVLEVLLTEPEPRTASIDLIRAKVILRKLRELMAADADMANGPLIALAAQDAAKGTAWVATLRAWFDAYGDMVRAAAAVNVHPNTFRYRLRRLTEAFGVDLSDPESRLVTELQLRLLD